MDDDAFRNDLRFRTCVLARCCRVADRAHHDNELEEASEWGALCVDIARPVLLPPEETVVCKCVLMATKDVVVCAFGDQDSAASAKRLELLGKTAPVQCRMYFRAGGGGPQNEPFMCMLRVGTTAAPLTTAIIPKLSAILARSNPAAARFGDRYGQVIVTGHGMGAALALVCGLQLQDAGFRVVGAFTFGCPRFCNRSLARHIGDMADRTVYHVSRANDPVPKLPACRDMHAPSGIPLYIPALAHHGPFPFTAVPSAVFVRTDSAAGWCRDCFLPAWPTRVHGPRNHALSGYVRRLHMRGHQQLGPLLREYGDEEEEGDL